MNYVKLLSSFIHFIENREHLRKQEVRVNCLKIIITVCFYILRMYITSTKKLLLIDKSEIKQLIIRNVATFVIHKN